MTYKPSKLGQSELDSCLIKKSGQIGHFLPPPCENYGRSGQDLWVN